MNNQAINNLAWDFTPHQNKLKETKYFDLQNYLDWLAIDTAQDFLCVFDSVRNIGKSTSIWNWIDEKIWKASNYTRKVCYWRTNVEKLKKVKESFNSLFQGKYLMTDNRIYRLFYDEKHKELTTQRQEIGAVCGLNNYENYKSNWFVNYAGIFWDEYNEKYQKKIYEAFIDLFKTVKRQNCPFFFIAAGNKVDGDSDLLVNFEVELPAKDYGIDIVQKIDHQAYYVNISKATFDKIEANQADDIVHRLATKNHTTNRYLNDSGYLKPRNRMVVLFRNIAESYKPIRTFAKQSYQLNKSTTIEFFEEGQCRYNGRNSIVFKKVDNPDANLPVVALDNYAYSTITEAINWGDEQFYYMWCSNAKEKLKQKQLYFTSNEALEEMLAFIIHNTQMLDILQSDPK